jgi:hypothetical protein
MIRKSDTGYVIIKSLPHYGEKAVPIGQAKDGQREFILLDCVHSETRVWLRREDLGQTSVYK